MKKYSITQQLKAFTGAAIGAIALLTGSAALAQTVTLDKVVAIVDNDVVMASELNQQMQMIASKMKASSTELPPMEVLQSQVLDHLIVERLQLQMGGRAGVQISDAELNQAIAQMQKANNLSREQFDQQLQQEGLTIVDLREQIRREMIVNRVQKGSVNRRIKISEQDIDNFLASKEGKFWTSPDYQLGHILIALSNSATVDEVEATKAKANDLYQKLQDGADFRQLAIASSAGQNALQGGDLGWRKTAQLPALFAEVIPNLSKGDISKPFRSGAGFHLLKIYDQRGGGEQLIEQSKVRHILVKPSTILSDDEAHKKLKEIRKRALAGEDFNALAKEHSEDIGSMLSGGDLGWSLPGQFVPEFEAMMKQTPVGGISSPFRSQFGWHILLVEDRRKEDMSETMKRNQASNLLRKRRFEEELQNWLREIRDEAYVEIKL